MAELWFKKSNIGPNTNQAKKTAMGLLRNLRKSRNDSLQTESTVSEVLSLFSKRSTIPVKKNLERCMTGSLRISTPDPTSSSFRINATCFATGETSAPRNVHGFKLIRSTSPKSHWFKYTIPAVKTAYY